MNARGVFRLIGTLSVGLAIGLILAVVAGALLDFDSGWTFCGILVFCIAAVAIADLICGAFTWSGETHSDDRPLDF